MLTDTAPPFDDLDNTQDSEPPERTRLTSESPELRRIFEGAGAALVDGDFATAQALTNELWARDEDVPVEAMDLIAITSAEPYRLRVREVPQELQYWLEHPKDRQQHHMEVLSDEDGSLHALWTGPDLEGLAQGVGHYVVGECTDAEGEVDIARLNEIMVSAYDGDFSKIPGVVSYQLRDHDAELIFSPDKEDPQFGEKISEMARAVSSEKRWGEVGFTFSVDEDGTDISGEFGDIHVFSETAINDGIDLEDAPKPMSSIGHTHPNAVPFSGSDLRMIMRYPDIPHMVIVGNNRGYLYLPGKGMSMFELTTEKGII